MKKYIRLMTGRTRLKCAMAVMMALTGAILASVWPVRLGSICTQAAEGGLGSPAQAAGAAAGFGLIFLSAESIAILRRVLLDCAIADHEAGLRESSISRLLRMPVSYYKGGLSGERNARLDQGISGLSQLIKIYCNDVAATLMTAVCTLYQVIVNAPLPAALLMSAYLLVVVGISGLQIRSQNGIREEIISGRNMLSGQVCQSLSNLELIRSLNAVGYETGRLRPFITGISEKEKRHHRFMGAFDLAKQASKVVFFTGTIAVGYFMISAGAMPAGSLITVLLLFQQLVKPVDEIYRFMDETASSGLKAKEIIRICEEDLDPVFEKGPSGAELSGNEIAIDGAAVREPGTDRVLAYYDRLRIPCDTVTAVCGGSGSGKTTLMRCLDNYFTYSGGSVRVLGSELAGLSHAELTEKLLYLPQKAFFFAGTIRENLVYGIEEEVSDRVLEKALRDACLYDSLTERMSEENGDGGEGLSGALLDYRIGEGGAGLSGGEGQRLALARIFLRRPRLFILDESTANLDRATADRVLDNIEAYAAGLGAGIIYISHDEHVVSRCREVIRLKKLIYDHY